MAPEVQHILGDTLFIQGIMLHISTFVGPNNVNKTQIDYSYNLEKVLVILSSYDQGYHSVWYLETNFLTEE